MEKLRLIILSGLSTGFKKAGLWPGCPPTGFSLFFPLEPLLRLSSLLGGTLLLEEFAVFLLSLDSNSKRKGTSLSFHFVRPVGRSSKG